MTIYTRSLQQIGSSILISLPTEWIKKNFLSKGKSVNIETNNDNSISIYSINQNEDIKIEFNYQTNNLDEFTNKNINNKDSSRRKTIEDLQILLNKIFGAYLLGYNIINIKSKEPISFEDSETIKKSIRKLIGLEIVDENNHNINLQ